MSDLSTARGFYDFFRSKFDFLEADDGPNPYFNIMTAYYERTHQRSYPWLRCCGFWNVFLRLDLVWDPRDDLFLLTVNASDVPPLTRGRVRPLNIDTLLNAVDPDWRMGTPKISPADGIANVESYAKAIKPHARELFLPARTPSTGLTGFSWFAAVSPSLK